MSLLGEDHRSLDEESLSAAWQDAWPDVEPPSYVHAATDAAGRGVTFRLGGMGGVLAAMPVPVPGGELDRPAATAWLWPNAQEDITRVAGHAIAWISGPGLLVDAHLHLTRIVVAANRATNALGVYWGAASHVIRADLFDDLAHRTGHLPVTLWIDFRGYVVYGRSSLFTVGLTAFGVMELEIANSVRRVGDLREFATGLAEYLIRNGPVIEAGHTVGGSENERFVVRHAPSMIDRPGMVYRLDGF